MKTHIGIALFLCLGLTHGEKDRLELRSQSIVHPEQHGIHGYIPENAQPGDEVILDPPLEVLHKKNKDQEICGYTIYKQESDMPFSLQKVDDSRSRARVVLADDYKLDYEIRRLYTFHIAAKDCQGEHSRRVKLHIHITDVNEHKPSFDQTSYVVEVLEGRTYDQILLLKAIDADGSDKFSDICHYHILTPGVPFTIDSNGVFKNTEPLDYAHNHNYILEVTAEDCGKEESLRSEKILISVKVREGCKPGWKGIEDTIDYKPGSNQKSIGENAALHMCDQCTETKVIARVRLTTQHIGKGCDRDTYSIQSQRKLCGASTGSVDLLSMVKGLHTDDGAESDQIYHFDGQTAGEVEEGKFNHTLGSHFTISTWMKHSENANTEKKHPPKETLMCNSDGEKMNRHHYSLFIHNCHLVYLVRQEPGPDVDMNVFKPAEFRWKIPQVCDGEWHHYALSVDYPEQVRLYVDGKLFVETQDNPDIVDDWPLHNSKVHFTRLMVGACWQGGEGKVKQYFNGYLAGLSILKGKTESDRVIQCLNNCKEKLDFQAVDKMDTGMSISLNSEMTEIEISGPNHTSIEKLVQQVSYVNARKYPTPGNRALVVETEIECEGEQKLAVPTVHSSVLVHQAEKPIITISGEETIAHTDDEFSLGVELFGSLRIISRTRKEEQELEVNDLSLGKDYVDTSAQKYTLDVCRIEADSNIDMKSESFRYQSLLAEQMGLMIDPIDKGLKISGADKVSVYEEVIRDIRYMNANPTDYNTRTFTLQCSELNGRFKSNLFTVKVNFIHKTHQKPESQAHAQENKLHQVAYKPVKGELGEHSLGLQANNLDSQAAAGATGASAGMIVIIVVCVGFLMFMIVLGVIRIRAAHQRDQVLTVEERPEMEWDHSELNITINPMEQDTVDFEGEGGHADDSDSDEDSDIVSYQDDMESSEEEPEKVKTSQGLEWDDSTF